MSKITIAAWLIFLHFCFSLSAVAQPAPRLFTTPDLRAELERRRLGYVSPEPLSTVIVDSISDLLAADEPEETIYSLEGLLSRDNGRSIIWLNGVAVPESELPDNIQIAKPLSKGQLKIVSASNQEYQLMPGQVLNFSTGTLYESYQWQEILARRRLQEVAAAAVSAGETIEAEISQE